MKKIFYTTLIIIGLAGTVQGQVSTFGFNYNISIPTGNLGDYVSLASYQGASFEYTYVPDESFGVHFEGGWNNFYEKRANASYERGTATLTGTQYRYSTNVPLLVGLNYFFLPESTVSPYVAVGAGTVYSRWRTEVGLYSLYADAWQFAFKPELGVNIGLSENTFIHLSTKYYQTIKTNDLKAQSFIAFNIGLAFLVE
jgi:opacity protein-like surface antigen